LTDRFAKALLGEGLASCDRCGHVAPMGEFTTLYFGEHGEHEDLCPKCISMGNGGPPRVHKNKTNAREERW
jgi:uncharacterized protein CbrC (UPF0167 family)